MEAKEQYNLKTAKNIRFFIPLFIAAVIAVFCAVIIISALHPLADGTYSLSFLAEGGTFRYNDPVTPGLSFSTYVMLLGLVVAVIVSVSRRRQYDMKPAGAAIATVLFFLASYLGAKLLYGVEKCIGGGEWSMGGQSLFGVLYMAVPAVPLIALLFRKKVNDMADFFVTTYLILLSFIRVTCFVIGCCHARTMYFGDVKIILPVQLFEIVIDLAILSLCLWLDRPTKNAPRGSGIAPVLLLTYCASRFLLEFIRSNPKFFLGMTISQCHCLLFFAIGAVWYCVLRSKSPISAGLSR